MMSTISGLKKTAGLFVTMSGNVEHARVARINNNMIHEKPGTIKIVKELPGLACIRGGINLSIERAEIKSIRIAGIDDQAADITARGAIGPPIIRILAGRISSDFGQRVECGPLRNKTHWQGR